MPCALRALRAARRFPSICNGREQVGRHAHSLCGLQAYEELFEWLEEEYDVASAAVTMLRRDTAALQALQPQPTLEMAKENISHMHAELYMTKSQAWLFRKLCCNCTQFTLCAPCANRACLC